MWSLKDIKHFFSKRFEKDSSLRLFCQVTGIVMLCIATAIAILIYANRDVRLSGGRDLWLLWPWCVGLSVLGGLQLFGVTIAFILSSLLSAAAGAWLVISVFYVPLPWSMLNILMGFVLSLPLITLLSFLMNSNNRRG